MAMKTKGLEETIEDQEEIEIFLLECDSCWELWKAKRDKQSLAKQKEVIKKKEKILNEIKSRIQ
jgi:hypothetical protein